MSAYTKKDMVLLSEAYDLRLLKENAPTMTINQVTKRLDSMTITEAEYINTVIERINEGWGGLKSLGGALKSAAQKGAGALAGKVRQGGEAIANTASAAGSGALAAGKQLASNAADIYQSGNAAASSADAIKKAQTSMQQLIDLVTKAQQMGLIQSQGAITDMTLADIIDNLSTAQQSAGTFQQNASNKGLTGGIGQAAKGAYQQARA